jgi:hypothetical protein
VLGETKRKKCLIIYSDTGDMVIVRSVGIVVVIWSLLDLKVI